jgi:methyl-accepting chemotaxis protein
MRKNTNGGATNDIFSIGKIAYKGKNKELMKKMRQLEENTSVVKMVWRKFSGLKTKLLLTIFLPIILMAIFGLVSYQKASRAIIANYEKSTTDTLKAVSDYLELGLKSVAGKSIEFMESDSVRKYYDRGKTGLSTDKEEIELLQPIGEDIMIAQGSNSFIHAIHVFGKIGIGVSTVSSPPQDVYVKFSESEEGQAIINTKARFLWVGEHPFIDQMFQTKKEEYALSVIRKMSYDNGFIVFDVAKSEITSMLSQFDYGDGSIVGFVTADGRETLSNTKRERVFSDLPYFKDTNTSQEEKGYSYETYEKEDYLYLYNKVGDTGAYVCALIPRSTIIKQAEELRTLNLIFVGFSSIGALIIGFLSAGSIASAIRKLSKSIAQAAKGDLTVKFETNRKDEFLFLSISLTNMVKSMSNLIGQAARVGSKVTDQANLLSATSENILGDTKNISITIDEIEKGIVQQANDTEQCFDQMSNLSDKINQVYDNTHEIEHIAGQTKAIAETGIIKIDELKEKSKATGDITEVVIHQIEELKKQSSYIESFVGMINEIAAQTNLLSLNASIEAARAGEAGKGFAVVAEEIRKLADQSMKAAKQIQETVSVIQSTTGNTVNSAKQAETIVKSQGDALNDTIHAFEDMNIHVERLVNHLERISEGVKEIEDAKKDTLEAIRSISAISQETAAASEEVSATANNQIGSVEHLSIAALELADDATKLQNAIQLFRIMENETMIEI